ncbi:hypothetical protein B5X24_HaOG206311 [Helicoverpa armigera]|nr:hypothetical protein B5X24_HaOG206311 [Helicoverpa armigera]
MKLISNFIILKLTTVALLLVSIIVFTQFHSDRGEDPGNIGSKTWTASSWIGHKQLPIKKDEKQWRRPLLSSGEA